MILRTMRLLLIVVVLFFLPACQNGAIEITERGQTEPPSLFVLGSEFESWSGLNLVAENMNAPDEWPATDMVSNGQFGLELNAPPSLIDGALIVQLYLDANGSGACEFGTDIAGTLSFEAHLFEGEFFTSVTPANFSDGPCPDFERD